METYIGNMKDLFSKGQGTSSPNQPQIAEEQTVTTLRRLNAQRNRIVLQFLQGAHLVGAQDPHIDLNGADLSYDDLGNAPLSGIDLGNANLSHADLAGADLSGTIMTGADLTGADLSGATLTGASLADASLAGTNLSSAHLGDAILTGADLGGADLGGADLGGADLPGADITQSQLNEAGSCADAVLSRPFTCGATVCHSTSGFTLSCQARPPIQLTYWYTESGTEVAEVKHLVNEFNKLHPDIHVNAVPKDFFHTRAAFISAVQQDNAPDVLRSDMSWTPLFASEGYLLNLDKYVPQGSLSDYENAPVSTTREIPPGAVCGTGPEQSAPLSYDECNGHLYGLPQEIDFPELLFNRDELKNAGINSPPATMEELRKDAVRMVEHKEKTGARYGFEFGGTSYYALPFLYACGGGMFDQQGNILVNSPQSVAGLNFLMNLQKVGNLRVMPFLANFSTPPGTMLRHFEDGTTAMIFDGPHDISNILKKGTSFRRDNSNLGIAPIPTGATGQTGSPLGGESYVISASTAHPTEAYKFIRFMSSTLSQVAIAKANWTLPTRDSAYTDLARHDPSSYRFISKFVSPSIMHTVIVPPPFPQAGYMFDAADPYIWDALTGVQSTEEALNEIAYSWNQLGGWKLLQSWPDASPVACS